VDLVKRARSNGWLVAEFRLDSCCQLVGIEYLFMHYYTSWISSTSPQWLPNRATQGMEFKGLKECNRKAEGKGRKAAPDCIRKSKMEAGCSTSNVQLGNALQDQVSDSAAH
jgi:hypothetical protein